MPRSLIIFFDYTQAEAYRLPEAQRQTDCSSEDSSTVRGASLRRALFRCKVRYNSLNDSFTDRDIQVDRQTETYRWADIQRHTGRQTELHTEGKQ